MAAYICFLLWRGYVLIDKMQHLLNEAEFRGLLKEVGFNRRSRVVCLTDGEMVYVGQPE